MEKQDELLLLIAVSGEVPADWIGRAAGSESYGASLLTRLKKEGKIKQRNADGIRGYLLRARAKKYLLEQYQKDIERYLTGAVCTNHVKSEPEKRLRLHRMSMVWIFYYHAGIKVWKSQKPELFPALHPSSSDESDEAVSVLKADMSYYGTSEWKLETDQELKGSRACGILTDRFGACHYLVYNTMESLMKWVPKTERNVRSRMELRIRRYRGGELLGAILMGTDMELLGRILTSDGGVKHTLFRLDDVYDEYYFIPFEPEAKLQLYLLCHPEALAKLNSFLAGSLEKVQGDSFALEAGTDSEGNPVYFCFLLELWRLKRIWIHAGIKKGRVFCFTYQVQVLKGLFPEDWKIEGIRPEKVWRYLGC